LLAAAGTPAGATELFEQGSEALLYNRPGDAATIFERVVTSEPANLHAHLYLALSYEQLGMYDRAIATLERAERLPGADRGLVRFNMANNYLHLGHHERAYLSYTSALEADPRAVSSYLNRANLAVTLERYPEAVADYTTVLDLAPEHRQRAQIERMIGLLVGHLEQARLEAEAEARRIAEEQRRREEAEARRLAEEQRQREEAEARRRTLLNNVLDSIRNSSDEAEGLSAGRERLDTYDDEFDIAD
jgi:tetratricopeptide (TPR) repeat protein